MRIQNTVPFFSCWKIWGKTRSWLLRMISLCLVSTICYRTDPQQTRMKVTWNQLTFLVWEFTHITTITPKRLRPSQGHQIRVRQKNAKPQRKHDSSNSLENNCWIHSKENATSDKLWKTTVFLHSKRMSIIGVSQWREAGWNHRGK